MSRPTTLLAALAVTLATASAVAGCGGGATATDAVTVYAAASLNTTFTALGALYEQRHPGSTVTFNFAGSNTLLEQISNGADADVFASADRATMDKAVSAGVIDGAPRVFTRNILTIVTPPGNPAGITSFADLARPGLSLVVCAPQVPCGNATMRIAESTGTNLAPVSEESSVTDVLSKVTTGQADAGLVYVTDAASAVGKVRVIDFPEAADAVNEYPIATAANAKNLDGAGRFIELVASAEGQSILGGAGFR